MNTHSTKREIHASEAEFSATSWNSAASPNYSTNVDKLYPYSEVPYIGQYKLLKIPLSLNDPIVHVDYWGEGRVITDSGAKGFTNCYNVNHQYRLVSHGADVDKKIPNRIPVASPDSCDTSAYIKDNSVKTVTAMGASISKSAAQDIARIVNADYGKVVVYSTDENFRDAKEMDEALRKKNVLLCSGHELPDLMREVTMFTHFRVYLNIAETQETLYKKVSSGAFDDAVNISEAIKLSNHNTHLTRVVDRLMANKETNLMSYAYKLSIDARTKALIGECFPSIFEKIFNGGNVKFVGKRHGQALKLDANSDRIGDRQAWGDSHDTTSGRVSWKLVPVWNNNTVYFHMRNNERGMHLKLAVRTDSYGDRLAWGGRLNEETRFQWILEPVKIDDELVFLIKNRQYGQGLKLDATVDSLGDRLLWGHGGDVSNNPAYFGWHILSWP